MSTDILSTIGEYTCLETQKRMPLKSSTRILKIWKFIKQAPQEIDTVPYKKPWTRRKTTDLWSHVFAGLHLETVQ